MIVVSLVKVCCFCQPFSGLDFQYLESCSVIENNYLAFQYFNTRQFFEVF
jgi:hypothetical protein